MLNKFCKIQDLIKQPLFIVLLVLICFFTNYAPGFLSATNLGNILISSTTIAVLAIAASFVLGSGGLDLSIGSIMASSTVCAVMLSQYFMLSPGWIIVLCLIIGALMGICNGIIIGKFALPAFIVTLGTMTLYRGLGYLVTDARPIYDLGLIITELGQGRILYLPAPIFILLVLVFVSYFILHHSVLGYRLLCLGDNETAVRNSGIGTTRLKIKIYALSGLLAGLAGLIFMARINAADPSIGASYELTAITAAIIGGTSLFGGRASIIGAVLGALTMGLLQNGLNLMAVPTYYQQIAIGIILICAMVPYQKRWTI